LEKLKGSKGKKNRGLVAGSSRTDIPRLSVKDKLIDDGDKSPPVESIKVNSETPIALDWG